MLQVKIGWENRGKTGDALATNWIDGSMVRARVHSVLVGCWNDAG